MSTPNDAAATARDALQRGWSVIPVRLDKRPALPTWKEFQHRRPTTEEFESSAARHPPAWAVVTGEISGVVVLDFDGPTAQQAVKVHGLQPHVRTGSGGYHLYVHHPGWPVPTVNSRISRELSARFPGIDIRGDGGYAVFAGRNASGPYEWLRRPDPDPIEILPDDLRRAFRLDARRTSHNGTNRSGAASVLTAALQRATSDGRNNAGFWLACQLRDNQLSIGEARQVMRSYVDHTPPMNSKGDSEPYTWSEARASLKQAYSCPRPWYDCLILNHQGNPRAILANAMTALRKAPEWSGVLAFNEFSLGVVALKSPPWGSAPGPEWTDHEDRLTANWMQHQGLYVPVDIAGQAVQTVAKDQRFHPVREYLDSLAWDGTPRIEGFLSLYFGGEPSNFTEAVGSRWLVSAVARIYRPGVKADCCLILEGPQGLKKSTALRILAGEWFTDEIAELGGKDSALQTRGVWVIELAELNSIKHGEVSKIKAFMSRSNDRFRPPYGKRLIESPRQCVFAGSVNHSSYLRDETGGRRFWPVTCTRILVDELTRDRDQLWAEAVAWLRRGAVWWLDSVELNREAEQEQAARFEGGPWDELIEPWVNGRDTVSIPEVLTLCIQKPTANWTQVDKNTVARCLQALGWARYRARTGNDLSWRYRRKQS